MKNSFFALILRMKWINRWGLMHSTLSDNLAEHSLDTAIFAHALCTIGNLRLGKNLDAERCALLAVFHDAEEIITGDLPTPIKYRSPALRELYRSIEDEAAEELCSHLPDDLRAVYRELLLPGEKDVELLPYVKAADKLSAYVKCLQEVRSGNREFEQVLQAQLDTLQKQNLPETRIFLEEFIPPFACDLDEQQALPNNPA